MRIIESDLDFNYMDTRSKTEEIIHNYHKKYKWKYI